MGELEHKRAETFNRGISTLSTLSDEDKRLDRANTSISFGRGFSRQVSRSEEIFNMVEVFLRQ